MTDPASQPPKRTKFRRWWDMSISDVDHDAVLHDIYEESGWSGRYAFLIVIAAGIALLGLLTSSAAVVIGAMLLSPLMMPIMGVGFSIATLDFARMKRSGIALVAGSGLAVFLSVVFVSLSPVQTVTSEIAARTQPTLFDLLVALLSALAGGYALIRGKGGTVVGVAIATALMPPLVVVGFGLATWNGTIVYGSALLFLTNAVTIALTAALVARLYGFGSHLSPNHTRWQLALFIGALAVLSVPLGTSLRRIAFEAVAQRQVRDTIRARFPQGSRLTQLDIDYGASPMRVRAVVLTPRVDPQADRALAEAIQSQLSVPIDVHVDQLRTSLDAGALEAAQIAQATEAHAARRPDGEREATDLALIAGIGRDAVSVDVPGRRLSAAAAPLPGLGLAGYRVLEERAQQALPEWQVRLAPPQALEPPAIAVTDGVIDDGALVAAAWGTSRLGRPVRVEGGTDGQRRAVADGITARGGRAEVGEAAGRLRLNWAPAEATPSPADTNAIGSQP